MVCADLILNGYIAFPGEQGLPFDVIFEFKNRLFKVQVKTTRSKKEIPQRKTSIPAYIFHIGNNGKRNRRKKYDANQVDVFALVALDTLGSKLTRIISKQVTNDLKNKQLN